MISQLLFIGGLCALMGTQPINNTQTVTNTIYPFISYDDVEEIYEIHTYYKFPLTIYSGNPATETVLNGDLSYCDITLKVEQEILYYKVGIYHDLGDEAYLRGDETSYYSLQTNINDVTSLSFNYSYTVTSSNSITTVNNNFAVFVDNALSGTESISFTWIDGVYVLGTYNTFGDKYLDLDTFKILVSNLDYINSAFENGEDVGYGYGYTDGYTDGKQAGYTEGVAYTTSQGTTASTIFSGIIEIALVPINFFLAILNFEVFGINIGAFVSATLTVAIIIIIIRIIVAGGNGGAEGGGKK